MELWLDTIDEKLITEANNLGILCGVTTNPSILSKENSSPEITLNRLLSIQSGFVAAQVTADNLSGMLKQAEKLSKLSSNNRMIIKIPAVKDGFKAMALLKKQGITTLATAVFEPKQLFLSSLAGASYIAPYFNRIHTSTGDALAVLREIQETINVQKFSIKIMAAAIKTSTQFRECAHLGVQAITVPANVYTELFTSSSQTEQSLEQFKEHWQANEATATSELFIC